ncbi:DUF6188 family protein [Allobranchiibius sp. GilTou73]|uniref:DUF6188 family protein n=1 Tax=Allobranchiibius sp. GilTou73 TaxID=2904523 RepID=UPI001F3EE260|nr:DUF6188 family protein [Allobranchiibius sp. GilTou73]UIJ33958.1 DUF6188 family protein [Allobranchiibius sp. GilTou73]
MDLDLVSCRVEQVDSENAITLRLSEGSEVRIETKLKLTRPDREVAVLDARDLDSEQGLLDVLLGRAVDQATADEVTGSLAVIFANGVRLDVAADPDYEAWSLVGRDGSLVVSLPGGGLSRWGSTLC